MYNEIVHHRATLFISSPIEINSENVTKISAVLEKYQLIPTSAKSLGFRITPQGIKQEDSITLEMKKLDESFKVIFGNDRIDIMRNKISENDGFYGIYPVNFLLIWQFSVALLILYSED